MNFPKKPLNALFSVDRGGIVSFMGLLKTGEEEAGNSGNTSL